MKKKIRVVQYGVGPIGAAIVRLMRQKQALVIAGAIDKDPEKVGRDLGEVVGAEDAPWGVTVSADPAEVLSHPTDVVVHTTSSFLVDVAGQLMECLEAGACVVSACEELSYPFRKHPELAAKLDEAAKESGVTLLGTGVNPGFVMDKLMLGLSAASQRVDHAKAVRIVDVSLRRLPLQKKVGVGLTVEEFQREVDAGSVKHVGLPESVAMLSDGLGLDVDTITETIEPVIATEPFRGEFIEVQTGQVSGIHQIARGMAHGEERVYLELNMYVGAADPSDTIQLSGEPNLRMVIPGGTHGDTATASIAVNAIPALLAAPAGLRTARDLPFCFFPPLSPP
ncbi:MAG TPA: dihydrodipicolinate reductase [Candidatus Dormibacteraeota bacterium]|nr:dihydrodipicolinate reductase [Candidatus Dormibacteraeota bacterium]